MNADGVKDSQDLSLFISYFRNQDQAADLADDNVIDNGDIMAFVADFNN